MTCFLGRTLLPVKRGSGAASSSGRNFSKRRSERRPSGSSRVAVDTSLFLRFPQCNRCWRANHSHRRITLPTLFTALKSHADEFKRIKGKTFGLNAERPTQAFPGVTGEYAAVAAVKAVPRKKRPKEPHPRLSLKDRFELIGKPAASLHVIVVGAGFAGLAAAYELE